MPENTVHNSPDIIGQNVVATIQPGMDTGTFVEPDGTTGTGADTYPCGEFFVIFFRIAGGKYQVNDVLFDGF